MFFSFTPWKRQKGRGTHIFHVLYSYVTMSQNELKEEILNLQYWWLQIHSLSSNQLYGFTIWLLHSRFVAMMSVIK